MTETTAKKVESEVATWRTNRDLYPGWLIAPNGIRQYIWRFTRGWITAVIDSLPEFRVEQRLMSLHELNWRLELSLLPLWENIAAAVSACLESINPFPEQIEITGAELKFSSDNLDRKEPNWQEIRRSWLELGFALLRFHREERHSKDFNHWAERLDLLCIQSPDSLARLCYERCLFALSEMDDEAVCRFLSAWPRSTSDPAWQIRRAGVLTEIGELREAADLTMEVLTKLRSGLRHTSDEIPSLSREGWTMMLMNGMEQYRSISGKVSRPDYRGRWEQLTGYRCNPRPELDQLESQLDQPVPLPKPSSTRKAKFQPGTYSQSHSIANSFFDKLIPAYSYLRLIEDTAYPPYCGNVILSASTLKMIAEWFIRHDPVRTQTLVTRLLDEPIIDSYLSRHRVASLSPEVIEGYHLLTVRTINQAQRRALSGGDPEREVLVERASRRLFAGIEILSRVVVRLPVERLPELWTLAVGLYSSPIVRGSMSLVNPLQNLFRSLIYSMQCEDLGRRILELIALPIPGSSSFPVAQSQMWPEFIHDLYERLSDSPAKSRNNQWSSVVGDLLEAAKSENPEVRMRAIVRLLFLHRTGYLKHTEANKLAKAYWRRVNDQTGLPEVMGLLNKVCLALPEPIAGCSIERFRRYALNTKLVPVQGGEVSPNSLLHDWLGATKIPGRTVEKRERQRQIDWTPEESSTLLRTICEWWEVAGRSQSYCIDDFKYNIFINNPFSERIELILDVLRQIVIPRTPRVSSVAEEVLNLVTDFDRHGMPVEAVLPALLLLRPDDEAASRLRHALASLVRRRYLSALRGLIYWLENQPSAQRPADAPQLPPPPNDLMQELGTIVASRRQPYLLLALNAVAVILRGFPETVDERFKRSVLIGLEYLMTETTYRAFEDREERIPYDEVPECREKSAEIAALLRSLLKKPAPIVEQWIEAAQNDPLPEVRRAIEVGSE